MAGKIEVVDCATQDWARCMRELIKIGMEFHLSNFDNVDEHFCSDYASLFKMTFRYDAERRSGIFKPVGLSLFDRPLEF